MKQSQRHYPIEEYFLIEEMSTVKHEYFDGEIFATSGGSRQHDTIAANITGLLHAALRASSCQVFTSNMRVRTPSGLYTYPDASVVCGPPDILRMQGNDTIGNPVVLVEVLSPSTRDYDRGQKFDLYRSIPTLRDYLLIEQTRAEVEHRYKAGPEWSSGAKTGLDQSLRLTGVDVELPLASIYERLDF